ncbi:phage holin family protein, partial [Enterococcus cecorum]|nr:phage holin family protein [Enterococcus cecorum]
MLTFIGITVFLPQLLYVDTFQTALLASFVLSILNIIV